MPLYQATEFDMHRDNYAFTYLGNLHGFDIMVDSKHPNKRVIINAKPWGHHTDPYVCIPRVVPRDVPFRLQLTEKEREIIQYPSNKQMDEIEEYTYAALALILNL
jgi:homoserine kinase